MLGVVIISFVKCGNGLTLYRLHGMTVEHRVINDGTMSVYDSEYC